MSEYDTPPTFHDLAGYTDAGPIRRLWNRYLIPNDPDASIRRHHMLGTPLVRKAIMGTLGRNKNRDHYRLSVGNKLDAVASFALEQTVYNESMHSFGVAAQCGLATVNAYTGSWAGVAINAVCGLAEASVVAVQRYNRARCIKAANIMLQQGVTFSAGYSNKAGIDWWAHYDYQRDAESSQEMSLHETGNTGQADSGGQ
jgi:hypothetical protein